MRSQSAMQKTLQRALPRNVFVLSWKYDLHHTRRSGSPTTHPSSIIRWRSRTAWYHDHVAPESSLGSKYESALWRTPGIHCCFRNVTGCEHREYLGICLSHRVLVTNNFAFI